MESEEFQKWASQVTNFICDYQKDIGKSKVSPDVKPGFLWARVQNKLTEEGEDFRTVFNDFRDNVMPGLVNWVHPMNFSAVGNTNAFPCILGDVISSAMGGVGFSWKSCPALTELEMLMCDWYVEMLGIDKQFSSEASGGVGGGCFIQTTSDIIYHVIMCSRYRTLKKLKKKYRVKDKYQFVPKLVVYASAECHFAVKRFCRVENIEFREIEPCCNGGLDPEDLAKKLEEDSKKDLVPMLVIATIGSFVKFAVDDVEEIYKVTKNYPTIWLHADATYGGNAMMLKRYHYMRNGLKYAHTFAASPNKWFPVSFDCPVILARNVKRYSKGFAVDAAYLRSENKDLVDLRHYGITLSRRFRALKMWFAIRTYGTDRIVQKLRSTLHKAKRFANILEKESQFEIIHKEFTFVNFVLKNAGDEKNKAFYDALNATGKILVQPIMFDAKFALKFSIIAHNTHDSSIDDAIELLKSTASSIK